MERIVKKKNYKAGDICFYDRETDMLIIVSFKEWDVKQYPSSRFVPIGVVVIPSSHDVYGTGQCGVMSLKEMNYTTPDEGSTSYQYMYWGSDLLLCGKAYPYCVRTNTTKTQQFMDSSPCVYSYLPSDDFNGIECTTDQLSFYHFNPLYPAPSPYLTDGSRNAAYYQTNGKITTENCLSDFDGEKNTENILNHVTAEGWKTNKTIENSCSIGNYPAACCCWRFHTEGTKQGDWYLPACGELGYLVTRSNTINQTIEKIVASYGYWSAVKVESNFDSYFSSSEVSNDLVRIVCLSNGSVNIDVKNSDTYVRAFLKV